MTPIDMLEKLREHLKLRVEDIIGIVGVSRPGYYGWKNGRKMNAESTVKAKTAITKLLKVGQSSEWRNWNTTHLTIQKRKEILDEMLSRDDPPNDPT